MKRLLYLFLFLLIASNAVAFDFPWGDDRWQGAAGAATPTYDMTLAIVGDSTLTIESIGYTSSGSPYTILGLSGLVDMDVTYGGTDNTTVFSGTDSGDVTGTTPSFIIDMDADKSLTCTFSVVSTEPAVGTVLFGSSAEPTDANQTISTGNAAYYWNESFTAAWSESASTTTVSTIEVWGWGGSSGNLKAYITDSSGTIISNGIATGIAVSYTETRKWYVLSFSTDPTITKGTAYKIAIIADGSSVFRWPYSTTAGTANQYFDNTGTYASPTDLAGTSAVSSITVGGIRVKK